MNPEAQPTDDTVRLIWNELVESDRMCRYYGYLAHRLKKLDELLRLTTVIAALTGCVAMIADLPIWVAFTALAFAVLSFVLSTARDYSAQALQSTEIFQQLGKIQLEWELLWNNIRTKDDDALLSSWMKLRKRQHAVVERVPGELPLSASLSRKAQSEAYDYYSAISRQDGNPFSSHYPGE